jgi:protein-S-isoprenylcysteine O-methyltransferase Ste14
MANIDYGIYGRHGVFWSFFGVTRAILSRRDRRSSTPSDAPVAEEEAAAPHAKLLVAVHGVAFMLMYIGVGSAVVPGRVWEWFPGQVARDHELALGGPFRFIRHPIYQGMNMLALGTAIWIPNIATWLAVAAMALGSDLRARAEEKLLVRPLRHRSSDVADGVLYHIVRHLQGV